MEGGGPMRIAEAIEIGNRFVEEHVGVSGDPEMVRLVKRDSVKSWMLVYPSSLINAELERSGTVVDGGEYMLSIDWRSKAVSVVG
jgi:hypothetical protein